MPSSQQVSVSAMEGRLKAQEKIVAGSRRYRGTISAIDQVADAPPMMRSLEGDLARLDEQLERTKKDLSEWMAATAREFDQWRLTQPMNRFPNGMSTLPKSTKRDERDSPRPGHDLVFSESKGYAEAWDQETRAIADLGRLKGKRMEMEEKIARLRPRVNTHSNLSALLAQIYDDTFAGPTPGYPEEDAAELDYTMAKADYLQIQTNIGNVALAKKLLSKAQEYTYEADRKLKLAASAAVIDGSPKGWFATRSSTSTDQWERREGPGCLIDAKYSLDRAMEELEEAMLSLVETDVARGVNRLGEMLEEVVIEQRPFDSTLNAYINKLREQLNEASATFPQVAKQMDNYSDEMKEGEGKELEAELAVASRSLQEVREGILKRTLRGEVGEARPPTYQEPPMYSEA